MANLLNQSPRSTRAKAFAGGSITVFRLAPSDYHRFHSPIDGIIGDIVNIPGTYYTGELPSSILRVRVD
jgi:phosphatidylserine decarboxylase